MPKYGIYDIALLYGFLEDAKDLMDFKTFHRLSEFIKTKTEQADADFDAWAKKEGLTG